MNRKKLVTWMICGAALFNAAVLMGADLKPTTSPTQSRLGAFSAGMSAKDLEVRISPNELYADTCEAVDPNRVTYYHPYLSEVELSNAGVPNDVRQLELWLLDGRLYKVTYVFNGSYALKPADPSFFGNTIKAQFERRNDELLSVIDEKYKPAQGGPFTDFATGQVHGGSRYEGAGVVVMVDGPNTEEVGPPRDSGSGLLQSYKTTLRITYIDAGKVLPVEKDFKLWQSKQEKLRKKQIEDDKRQKEDADQKIKEAELERQKKLQNGL